MRAGCGSGCVSGGVFERWGCVAGRDRSSSSTSDLKVWWHLGVCLCSKAVPAWRDDGWVDGDGDGDAGSVECGVGDCATSACHRSLRVRSMSPAPGRQPGLQRRRRTPVHQIKPQLILLVRRRGRLLRGSGASLALRLTESVRRPSRSSILNQTRPYAAPAGLRRIAGRYVGLRGDGWHVGLCSCHGPTGYLAWTTAGRTLRSFRHSSRLGSDGAEWPGGTASRVQRGRERMYVSWAKRGSAVQVSSPPARVPVIGGTAASGVKAGFGFRSASCLHYR